VSRFALRSNSGTPVRSSSSCTIRLTAAGVTLSSPAALAKLSARAAASNARMPLRKGSLRIAPSSRKLVLILR
jgi:hypothetical protein